MGKEKWITLVSFVLVFKKIRAILVDSVQPFIENLRAVVWLSFLLAFLIFSLWIVANIALAIWVYSLTQGWLIPLLVIGLLHLLFIQIIAFRLIKRTRNMRVRLPDGVV